MTGKKNKKRLIVVSISRRMILSCILYFFMCNCRITIYVLPLKLLVYDQVNFYPAVCDGKFEGTNNEKIQKTVTKE